MFSSVRIALFLVILASAGGGYWDVKTLQADLATAKENILKLKYGGQKKIFSKKYLIPQKE